MKCPTSFVEFQVITLNVSLCEEVVTALASQRSSKDMVWRGQIFYCIKRFTYIAEKWSLQPDASSTPYSWKVSIYDFVRNMLNTVPCWFGGVSCWRFSCTTHIESLRKGGKLIPPFTFQLNIPSSFQLKLLADHKDFVLVVDWALYFLQTKAVFMV